MVYITELSLFGSLSRQVASTFRWRCITKKVWEAQIRLISLREIQCDQRYFWPELPPVEELSTSSSPADDLLPPALWSPASGHTHTNNKCFMYAFCFTSVSGYYSVCMCTYEHAPLSQWWAVWSSCRCRKAPPPREPHASRPREKYPGSCHVSSGSYGNQWSSGSVDNKEGETVLCTWQTDRQTVFLFQTNC